MCATIPFFLSSFVDPIYYQLFIILPLILPPSLSVSQFRGHIPLHKPGVLLFHIIFVIIWHSRSMAVRSHNLSRSCASITLLRCCYNMFCVMIKKWIPRNWTEDAARSHSSCFGCVLWDEVLEGLNISGFHSLRQRRSLAGASSLCAWSPPLSRGFIVQHTPDTNSRLVYKHYLLCVLLTSTCLRTLCVLHAFDICLEICPEVQIAVGTRYVRCWRLVACHIPRNTAITRNRFEHHRL